MRVCAADRTDPVTPTASGSINYEAVLELCADVARAMAHLHHLNILHGDLKARNVLLQGADTPSTLTGKVSPFRALRYARCARCARCAAPAAPAVPAALRPLRPRHGNCAWQRAWQSARVAEPAAQTAVRVRSELTSRCVRLAPLWRAR